MFTRRSICQSICLSSAFQLSAMLTKDPDESQWYIYNMYTSTQPQSHTNTLEEKKRKEKKTAALFLLSTRVRDSLRRFLSRVLLSSAGFGGLID